MATLQESTITSLETANIYRAGEAMSPWYKFYHCQDAPDTSYCNPTYACGWLHVRTPIPADEGAGSIGWLPNLIEIVGFHTYSGENFHDYMFVANTTGDGNNTWYGSQLRVDHGNVEDPVMYRSSSTYGGYRRVCFAMRKSGCCCVGWYWVRFRNSSAAGYRADYPWAQTARANSSDIAF